MALGDTGNYGNSSSSTRKVYDSTYYSRIRIKNKDKLCVDFTFCKGLLKMKISQEKENYKYNDVIEINISATKAKLLIAQLKPFIEDMKAGKITDPNYGVGINTGVKDTVTFIAFKITGNRPDVPEHEMVIGKVNSSGAIEDVVSFVFNVDYDYSLIWSNVNDMEVEKEIDQFMGIKTVLDVLTEFANTSAGALGASVWDTGRYETNRIIRSIHPVYEKLGIDVKSNSNNNRSGNSGGNSFFDRQGASSGRSTSKSYEDIEDMLS